MIYIKRFLWALGWIPVFTLALILGLASMLLCPFVGLFYYIKNGNIETASDKYLPFYWSIQLENVYRKLEPKSRKSD